MGLSALGIAPHVEIAIDCEPGPQLLETGVQISHCDDEAPAHLKFVRVQLLEKDGAA